MDADRFKFKVPPTIKRGRRILSKELQNAVAKSKTVYRRKETNETTFNDVDASNASIKSMEPIINPQHEEDERRVREIELQEQEYNQNKRRRKSINASCDEVQNFQLAIRTRSSTSKGSSILSDKASLTLQNASSAKADGPRNSSKGSNLSLDKASRTSQNASSAKRDDPHSTSKASKTSSILPSNKASATLQKVSSAKRDGSNYLSKVSKTILSDKASSTLQNTSSAKADGPLNSSKVSKTNSNMVSAKTSLTLPNASSGKSDDPHSTCKVLKGSSTDNASPTLSSVSSVKPDDPHYFSKVLKRNAIGSMVDDDADSIVDETVAEYSEVVASGSGNSRRRAVLTLNGTFSEPMTTSISSKDIQNLAPENLPPKRAAAENVSSKRQLDYGGNLFGSDSSPTFSHIITSTPVAKIACLANPPPKSGTARKPAGKRRPLSFGDKLTFHPSTSPEEEKSVPIENTDHVFPPSQSPEKDVPENSTEKGVPKNSTVKEFPKDPSNRESEAFLPDETNEYQSNFGEPVSKSTTRSSALSSIKHYADVTTNYAETGCVGRKKRRISFESFLEPPKIIVPDPTKFTPGCRRSKRTRVGVVRHWAGEHLEYDRDVSGNLFIKTVDKVIIKDPLMKKYGALEYPSHAELAKKRKLEGGPLTRSKLNKTARNLSVHVADEKGGDKLKHITSPCVELIDAKSHELKPFDCIADKSRLIYVDKNDEPAAENEPVVYTKALDHESFASGNMVIRPFETCSEFAKKTCMFVVIFGKLTVTFNTTDRSVQSGDHFFVPKDNKYKIKNLRKDEAKLIYCQIN